MNSQSWIVNPAKEQGFISNEEGICFGYAFMASQALLCEDINSFEDRVKLIKNIKNAKLLKIFIENSGNKNIKFELIKGDGFDELSIINNNLLTKIRIAPSLFLDNEQDLKNIMSSIPAFYNGIELYFQASHANYTSLFEPKNKPHAQHYQSGQELVLPEKLVQQGGVKEMSNFSGQYNSTFDLGRYVAGFIEVIKNTDGKIPLSNVMESINHAITMGYDPLTKEIILCDANSPSVKRFALNDKVKMIESIFKGFFKENLNSGIPIMFTSKMFVRGNDADFAKPYIDNWAEQSERLALDNVNKKNAALVDVSGFSWLYLASRDGQVELTKKLLEYDASQNLDSKKSSPLYNAAARGHIEVVNELLRAGAEVDAGWKEGTPLFIAALTGKVEIVKLLIANNADINKDRSGVKPFHMACDYDHVEVADVLLKNGALINEKCKGYTPLYVAVSRGNIDTVKLLIHHGADVNLECHKYSALYCAAEKGQLKIVDLLLKAGATAILPALVIAARKKKYDVVELLAIKYLDNLNAGYQEVKRAENNPNVFHDFFGMKNTLSWQAKAKELRESALTDLKKILNKSDDKTKEKLIEYAVKLDVFKEPRGMQTEETNTVKAIKGFK
jgi:ankyrin repeat protein